MTSQHQNTFSDRKIYNTTMVTTSLNGPIYKQKNSNKIYDKSSNITKKESAFIYQNSKDLVNINNEYCKLEKIYLDKKIELDMSCKEYKEIKESYIRKSYSLEQIKQKYELMKQKNENLKLMIMNLMKLKNITKNQ
jgi:hypothetical protein